MKRWPIIRHIRWFLLARQVDKHYWYWRRMGYHLTSRALDDAALDMVWRGED